MNDLRANRWQLPDGVNELLPDDAWRVELLRRQVMDSAGRWGYDLVMPPMIEYLDSLLTGTGEKLDLQTFKIIDQHNGRLLGIRADMTPQVARMDAHALRDDGPTRLFYIGSVLRARTDGAGSSRTPFQFGAELFGHSGPESDAEIIRLMLDSVMQAGLQLSDLTLDVGHVGVYQALIEFAGLSDELEKQVFDSLIRGSHPEVMDMLRAHDKSPSTVAFQSHIDALMQLSGDSQSVLRDARERLAGAGEPVQIALNNLQAVLDKVTAAYPSIAVHIDLAELRGYSYHTGILFTLFDSAGTELSRGGRYDDIGEAFGKARPATGFSGDLYRLALHAHTNKTSAMVATGIWVDADIAEQAMDTIGQLRDEGERVVMSLPGSISNAHSCRCNRQLVLRGGTLTVEKL